MRTGRVRVWIALAVGAPTLVACTALLGTYEVDPAGSDAGRDSVSPPVDTGTDALVDTGAADAGRDTGTDALDAQPDAADDAGPCDPNDPLVGPVTLISELNDPNFEDKGARPTPDGNYLLFQRRDQKAGAADKTWNIHIAERIGGKWSVVRKPSQLEGVNPDGSRTNEESPMFVPGPTPRIVFSSDRLVPLPDGGRFFSNLDFYYADVKTDFSQIGVPQRILQTNPISWHSGGLEGEAFVVPSATVPGTGRAFFSAFVATNHSDLFYLDYDDLMVGTERQSVTAANLPDHAQEYSPVFGNGFLYFTSTRVPLPDGGVEILPDGALNVGRARVWASKASTSNPPTFSPPVLIQDLSGNSGNTQVTWVSPDGCSLVLASDRPGGGLMHLYTAKRKPKKP